MFDVDKRSLLNTDALEWFWNKAFYFRRNVNVDEWEWREVKVLDLQSVKVAFDVMRGALDSINGLKDMLPKGAKREEAESKLAEAGRQIALAEAQFALCLGYKLCKCAFPPTPMLSTGLLYGRQNFRCKKCGANSVHGPLQTKAITDFDVFDN